MKLLHDVDVEIIFEISAVPVQHCYDLQEIPRSTSSNTEYSIEHDKTAGTSFTDITVDCSLNDTGPN